MQDEKVQQDGQWSGQSLYLAWCGSPHSDLAAYWRSMNIAEQAKWAKLADRLNGDMA